MSEKLKLPKCLSNRGFVTARPSPDYSELVEHSNVDSFLKDYQRITPVPFKELVTHSTFRHDPIYPEDCLIKSRKGLCKDCAYSVENCTRQSEACSIQESFIQGWSIPVTQNQPLKKAPDGTFYAHTSITPLTMKDVRLNGRPAQLVISRTGWAENKKRQPTEVVSGIQVSKKETMTLRLINAINEACLTMGPKYKYIAEGYGISLNALKVHLNRSVQALQAKQVMCRDDAFLKSNPYNYRHAPSVSFSRTILDRSTIAVFDFSDSSGHLVNFCLKESLTDVFRLFQIELQEGASAFSISPKTMREISNLTRLCLDSGKSIGGIPAELVHLVVLLWLEISSQLAQAHYTYNTDIVALSQDYLDAAFTPILQDIFLYEHGDDPLSAIRLRQLCDLFWGLDTLDSSRLRRISTPLAQFADVYARYEEESESPLQLWEAKVYDKCSPEQNLYAKEVMELIESEAAHCSEVISAQDIINHVLYLNEAVSPPDCNRAPNPVFLHTPIGTLDTSIDVAGIPLHCLTHLLNGGLLSEDYEKRPTCIAHRLNCLASDFDPCRNYDCPGKWY